MRQDVSERVGESQRDFVAHRFTPPLPPCRPPSVPPSLRPPLLLSLFSRHLCAPGLLQLLRQRVQERAPRRRRPQRRHEVDVHPRLRIIALLLHCYTVVALLHCCCIIALLLHYYTVVALLHCYCIAPSRRASAAAPARQPSPPPRAPPPLPAPPRPSHPPSPASSAQCYTVGGGRAAPGALCDMSRVGIAQDG